MFVEELPPGTMAVGVTAGGDAVCVYNADGRIGAVSNVCTHQAFPMCDGILEETAIQCAWHGARFDLATGAVLEGPAVDPLPVYDVRVEGGEILIGQRV